MMSATPQELWLKFVSDDPVSETESKQLLRQLTEDNEFADTMMADAAIDSMLKDLDRLDKNDVDFVDTCCRRIEQKQENGSSLQSETTIEEDQVFEIQAPPRFKTAPRFKSAPSSTKKSKTTVWIYWASGLAAACAIVLVAWNQAVQRGKTTASHDSNQPTEQNGNPSPEHDDPSNLPENGSEENLIADPHPMEPKERANELIAPGLARFEVSNDAKFDLRPTEEGFELSLDEGLAQMHLERGDTLAARAPTKIQLKSPDQVELIQGELLAQTDEQSDKRINVNVADSLFELYPDSILILKTGSTFIDALTDQGQVQITPCQSVAKLEPITLQPEEINRVQINTINNQATQENTLTYIEASGDRFVGLLGFNDRFVNVQSRKASRQLLDNMITELNRSPDRFVETWSQFSDRFNSDGIKAELVINGQSMQVESIDEFFDAPQQLAQIQNEQASDNDQQTNDNEDPTIPSNNQFTGKLTINGQTFSFSSREEFLEAQRQMFGPMMNIEFPDQGENDQRNLNNEIPNRGNFDQFHHDFQEEMRQKFNSLMQDMFDKRGIQ